MLLDLNHHDLLRYNRQINLEEVGVEGQKRLKNARVLCVGAGGLGSPLLLYLAAAGVGTLGIVDHDVVDLSNLQRQILYTMDDINQSKADCAQRHLLALNPHLTIHSYNLRLDENNIADILRSYDFVADLSDNFPTRFLINDRCQQFKIPTVYASIFQFEGQLSVFNAEKGPCYRCLFPVAPAPELRPNCATGGVLGVLPGVMGALQATEIIKLILQIGHPLIARLLTFNALSLTFKEFAITKNADCHTCYPDAALHFFSRDQKGATLMNKSQVKSISVQEFYALKQKQGDFFLLDVREPYEYEISNLGGYLIPLSELPARLNEIDNDKCIIVHCKVGGRSKMAAEILSKAGFALVKNLEGGIDAWIEEIDPSLPKY